MNPSRSLLGFTLIHHPPEDVICALRLISAHRSRGVCRKISADAPSKPSKSTSTPHESGSFKSENHSAPHSQFAKPLAGILYNGLNLILRRLVHTDVHFPNFDEYRSTLDVTKAASETEDTRRAVPQMIYYGVGGMMSLIAAKESVQAMVAFKAMARDQVARANTIVNMEEIPEGETKTYEWQGKPVFVKHRTPKEIQQMKEVNVGLLRHPERDDQRVHSKNEEWLVVLGVCTHLGCTPIPNSDEFVGGWKCPCHGAYFDAAGRIRKGPAPLNLTVPPYAFKGDNLVIGASDK